ncbi:MAG TPA: hypothetical protein VFJ06_05305 [Halococcus sp.]|nr:hypothetical protein [Halococcus sp.]
MTDYDNHGHDDEHDHDERAARWSVFGKHGGKIGPVMVSTAPTVLRATAQIFGAIAIWGFAIWLVVFLPIFGGILRWVAVGIFAGMGLLNIHIILIELYYPDAHRVA